MAGTNVDMLHQSFRQLRLNTRSILPISCMGSNPSIRTHS